MDLKTSFPSNLSHASHTKHQPPPLMGRTSYRWSAFTQRPGGSNLSVADISGSRSTVAWFRPDVPGHYTLNLAVKGHGVTYTDPVNIFVYDLDDQQQAESAHSIRASPEQDCYVIGCHFAKPLGKPNTTSYAHVEKGTQLTKPPEIDPLSTRGAPKHSSRKLSAQFPHDHVPLKRRKLTAKASHSNSARKINVGGRRFPSHSKSKKLSSRPSGLDDDNDEVDDGNYEDYDDDAIIGGEGGYEDDDDDDLEGMESGDDDDENLGDAGDEKAGDDQNNGYQGDDNDDDGAEEGEDDDEGNQGDDDEEGEGSDDDENQEEIEIDEEEDITSDIEADAPDHPDPANTGVVGGGGRTGGAGEGAEGAGRVEGAGRGRGGGAGGAGAGGGGDQDDDEEKTVRPIAQTKGDGGDYAGMSDENEGVPPNDEYDDEDDDDGVGDGDGDEDLEEEEEEEDEEEEEEQKIVTQDEEEDDDDMVAEGPQHNRQYAGGQEMVRDDDEDEDEGRPAHSHLENRNEEEHDNDGDE